jgi:hypothetical protein
LESNFLLLCAVRRTRRVGTGLLPGYRNAAKAQVKRCLSCSENLQGEGERRTRRPGAALIDA